jgi:hypothetical protein
MEKKRDEIRNNVIVDNFHNTGISQQRTSSDSHER